VTALAFRSAAATHAGSVRAHNEDSYVDRPDIGLWAVADGAGGHAAGEVASRMVADALSSIPPGLSAAEMLAQVRLRIAATHLALREEAARRGRDAVVATTVVVLLIRDAHFACLWAGDSRAYLLRDGHLAQVSRDHSLVQEMVDAGALAPELAEGHAQANIITRAVGAAIDELALDKVTGAVARGDRFLLCSDGLCKVIPDDAIAAALGGGETAEAVNALVAATLAQGAPDNVTAIAIEAQASGAHDG
jgi:protein phosphatase/serine/threonine-protein phosphatase Stp1